MSFLELNELEKDQIFLSIYADYKSVAILLIGANEDIDRFWILKEWELYSFNLKSINQIIQPYFEAEYISNFFINNRVIFNFVYENYFESLQYKQTENNTWKEVAKEVDLIESLDIENSLLNLKLLTDNSNLFIDSKLLDQQVNILQKFDNFQHDIKDNTIFAILQTIQYAKPRMGKINFEKIYLPYLMNISF